MHSTSHRHRLPSASVVTFAILLGCGDEPCVIPPCAPPIAIDLAVSAPNAPAGIVGLSLTVGGVPQSCQSGAISHCYVQGPAGDYELQLNAPGYIPVKLGVTVNGVQAKCSCMTVETKQLTVVMHSD